MRTSAKVGMRFTYLRIREKASRAGTDGKGGKIKSLDFVPSAVGIYWRVLSRRE